MCERERERERDRERERGGERKRKRESKTKTETEREREKEKERETREIIERTRVGRDIPPLVVVEARGDNRRVSFGRRGVLARSRARTAARDETGGRERGAATSRVSFIRSAAARERTARGARRAV